MKIKRIEIRNFRGVSNLSLDLTPRTNVLVGINGSGKTTILDAITISLSWLAARIQRPNSNGKLIPEGSIRYDEPFSEIEIFVSEGNTETQWKIHHSRKGELRTSYSELEGVSALADFFRNQYQVSSILPVLAVYPVNRTVAANATSLGRTRNFDLLDVFDNALGGLPNFQAFFEWFKNMDDINNELLTRQSGWTQRNSYWFKRRVDQIRLILTHANIGDQFSRKIRSTFNLIDNYKKDPKFGFLVLANFNKEIINFLFENGTDREADWDLIRILFRISNIFEGLLEIPIWQDANLENEEAILISELEEIIPALFEPNIISQFDSVFAELGELTWVLLWAAVQSRFWWVSDKAMQDFESIFSEHHRPFGSKKVRLSSQHGVDLLHSIRTILRNELQKRTKAEIGTEKEYTTVKQALQAFLPNYTNLRISRIPRPSMLVDKNGKEIRVDQLSDGEKNLIALVGDIARRMSMANSHLANPLHGQGVIMIDEVELHLHASWQRLIIPRLSEVFPNCQFILTTHSPQVLSHVHAEGIFVLDQQADEIVARNPQDSYGLNSDRILEDILGVDSRPIEVKMKLSELFRTIQHGTIAEARKRLAELEETIANDPELVKANVLIKRKEVIGR